MMDKYLLLLFSLLTFSTAFAQDDEEVIDDGNLVANGNFENVKTKTLKTHGMLDDLCMNWFSATQFKGDIYASGIKGDKVNIPNNSFGKQDALSGHCYAGFRAYSKDKKYKRSYLQIELDENLEKDQQYCFRFNVSLADLSKYGTNGIGVYVSDRKIDQPNTGTIAKKPQILHKSNKVMTTMDGWETICGTFIATGVEQYIIIGCFERDDKVRADKVKRPKGFTGAQIYHAYYYVDDVEVKAVEAKSQCFCGRADDLEPDLIYSKSVMIDPEMGPRDIVSNTGLYYAFIKSQLNAVGKRDLDRVAKLLKENASIKLEVVGHCDNDEFDEGKVNPRYRDLGKKRADRVVEYLIEQGISEMRLIPKTKENTAPANTRPTPLSKAQNRRVVFVVR